MFSIYVFIIFLGLITGIFLNLCICRMPFNLRIFRCFCYHCKSYIKIFELICAVFLRKCPHCRAKLLWKYPVIELLTAVIFIIMYNKYGFTIKFFADIFLSSILIIVTFIDIQHKIIPNKLLIFCLAAGFLIFMSNIIYNYFIIFESGFWTNHLLGAFIGSGTLGIVAALGCLIYKNDDAMGLGDVKLFFVIGLFLGWKMTIVALILSVFLAAFLSVILILTGIKERKSTLPFGPFIAVATIITLLFGWDLLKFYIQAC